MKTNLRFPLGALALCAVIGQANAAFYDFTYSDVDGNIAHGSLGTVVSGGNEWATSGFIDVTGGAEVGTYNLISNPNAPAASYSTDGLWIYDNVIYASAHPYVNNNGLLFGAGGIEVNIYNAFQPGDGPDSFWSSENGGYHVTSSSNGRLNLEAVPEPFSMSLAGGAALLAFSRMRRIKKSSS